MNSFQETKINLVSENTKIQGEVNFDAITYIHGTVIGKVRTPSESTLVLCETGVIEGDIEGDTIFINGYINGNINAKTKLMISKTGRVIGNIQTLSLTLEFGAHFEGDCSMSSDTS